MGVYYGNELEGILISDSDGNILFELKLTITKEKKDEIIQILQKYPNTSGIYKYHVYTSASCSYSSEQWYEWQHVLIEDIYRELKKL